MGIRRKNRQAQPAEQAVPHEKHGFGLKDLVPESISEGVDTAGDWLGTGARIGSGFFGTLGGIPGAVAGGAGELLAQFLEGSLDWGTPGRVGVEAAVGAVPFGKLASGRRALTAFGKTGATSVIGDLGRQVAEGNFHEGGEGWQKGRTLMAGGLGGGTGLLFNKLQPGIPALPKPEPQVPPRTLSTPRRTTDLKTIQKEDDLALKFDEANRAFDTRRIQEAQEAEQRALSQLEIDELKKTLNPQSPVLTETVKTPGQALSTRFTAADEVADDLVDITSPVGEAVAPEIVETVRKVGGSAPPRVQQLLTNLDEKGLKHFDHLYNVEGQNPQAAYRIALQTQAMRLGGAKIRPEPAVATVAEEVASSPVVDDVAEALPAAAQGEDAVATLRRLLSEAEEMQQSTHPSFYDEGFDALENAADAQIRQQSTHPSFFEEGFEGLDLAKRKARTPTGKPPATAQAKLDEAAQSYPPEALDELKRLSVIYNDPDASKAARKEAGKGLKKLSEFMSGKSSPKAEAPAAGADDWVAQQSAVVDKLSDLNNEKGFANIENMLSTAFGTAGALVGGALDAGEGEDSAWDGALAGLVAGAGAPQLPKLLNELASRIDPTNIKQVKETAARIVAKMPQIQRASLLTNPSGSEQFTNIAGQDVWTPLPALGMNAAAGPYGAVMTTAIESILKRDPRGWELLKLGWNPVRFGKGLWDSKDEAWEALVRGEEGTAGQIGAIDPTSSIDHLISYPGQVMTMGDTYARKLLGMAGYTPAEARIATLTSEPDQFRGLSNVGKKNWWMQMMFPFRRTPVNILEQGIARTPGLSQFSNTVQQRVDPRSMNDQVVEQGLGSLWGLLNYGIASNIEDDATRRNVRRLTSNIGGRYSLPGQIGYILGDAAERGTQPISEQNFKQLFPLPSTEVVVDSGKKLYDLAQGKGDFPSDLVPDSLKYLPLRRWLSENTDPNRRDPFFNLNMQDVTGIKPRNRGIRRRSRRSEQ